MANLLQGERGSSGSPGDPGLKGNPVRLVSVLGKKNPLTSNCVHPVVHFQLSCFVGKSWTCRNQRRAGELPDPHISLSAHFSFGRDFSDSYFFLFQGRRGEYGPKGSSGPPGAIGEKVCLLSMGGLLVVGILVVEWCQVPIQDVIGWEP